MRRGIEMSDYVVTVGAVVLYNVELLDHQLTVRLVDLQSYDRGDDRSCGDHYTVRVRNDIRVTVKQPQLPTVTYSGVARNFRQGVR